MADRILRGTVTRIDANGVYVEVPKLGLGVEYGPCEVYEPPITNRRTELASGGGSGTPVIFVDPIPTRTEIAEATSLRGIASAWNNGIGKVYGLTLRIPTASYTRFGWLHTALTEAELPQARAYVMGMVSALARHQPRLILWVTQFTTVDLISQSPDFGGWALPDLVTMSVGRLEWTGAQLQAQGWETFHHELTHIYVYNYAAQWQPGTAKVRADWLENNPPGFVYSGVSDKTGPLEPPAFASQYARTNYFEDTAETLEAMFGLNIGVTAPRIRTRIETDPRLHAKVKIMADWLAEQGMTSFATWFDAPTEHRHGLRLGLGAVRPRDRVLVSTVNGVKEDLVVLGRLV